MSMLQDDLDSAELFKIHADPGIPECSKALCSTFQSIVCTRHSKRPSSAQVCVVISYCVFFCEMK